MIVDITTALTPCADSFKLARQWAEQPATLLHVARLKRRVTPQRARDNAEVALESAQQVERLAGPAPNDEQRVAIQTWKRLHEMWLAVAQVLE